MQTFIELSARELRDLVDKISPTTKPSILVGKTVILFM